MKARVRILTFGAVVLGAGLLTACGGSSGTTSTTASPAAPVAQGAAAHTPASSTSGAAACVTGQITAAGSTAIQPLAEAAAKQYMAQCPGATITVQGGGSGTGLSQVASGAVQIGNSDIKAEEKSITGLVDHVVARQGFAIVTNKDVTVANLTKQQATDIFTCKKTNWKDFGGADEPIVVVLRPQSSGTRTTFRDIVLDGAQECQSATTLTQDSNGAVRQAVEQTKGAISVIGFAYFADPQTRAALNVVSYEGVAPSVQNIGSGAYKIASDANMYTKGEATGLTKAFLDFMLSPDVQTRLIPSLNFGPVKGA
jgi:phosphate transport system substrate-binding protein